MKLVYAINISLDAVCDHTKGMPTEDVHEFHGNLIKDADVLLYGRKTYELMVPFWPDVAKNNSGDTKYMNDFARAFDAVNRIVVFSKTLENPPGKKTKVIRGNLEEEIIKLKQEPGRNILLGGVDLPTQLMKLGLIDEYRIVIQPTVVGEGRRLFDGKSLAETLQLKLIDSTVFPSGCVALSLKPA